MKIDPCSIAQITSNPQNLVEGWSGSFGVYENTAVWIDDRDPCGIPSVFGVNLNDITHQEFVIDLNAPGCSGSTIWGKRAVYRIQLLSGVQYLQVADIADQQSPFIFKIQPQIDYVSYVDISGSIVAYAGSDVSGTFYSIYAADISDANNVHQYLITTLTQDHPVSGLTIDANHIAWSISPWEPNAFVQVADITNLSEPEILTAYLPANIVFDDIDASGKWLVAHGRYQYSNEIFGVPNYYDSNNWNVKTLWIEGNGEYFVSGPRIDQSICVWVATTRMPSMQQKGILDTDTTENMIKGCCFLGNSGFTVSELRRVDHWLGAAEISDSNIVWSEYLDKAELFKGAIELVCGDWGYKRADLNQDCTVDFRDFAIFAEDWLQCTMPDDPQCGFGN
jgi:hypothetical protein